MSVISGKLLTVKESPNLDLLRSFAVLCVFVCHLHLNIFQNESFDGVGRLGVLLFFIHTSYVLLMSLTRNGDSWAQFQVRRIFRIYPLAIVACIAYLVIGVPSDFSHGAWRSESFISPSVILQNFLLIQNLTKAQPIPRVLWSLPFEVQMYLALPLVWRVCSRFALRGAVILYAASVAAVIAVGFLTNSSFTRPLLFVPCFLAGAILFVSNTKARFSYFWIAIPLSLALASCFNSEFFNIVKDWILCLLIALVFPLFRECTNRSVVKTAKLLATYSFGIYLFHEAAMYFAFSIFRNTFTQVVLSMLLTAIFSISAYRFVELPLINVGKQFASRLLDDRVHYLPMPHSELSSSAREVRATDTSRIGGYERARSF